MKRISLVLLAVVFSASTTAAAETKCKSAAGRTANADAERLWALGSDSDKAPYEQALEQWKIAYRECGDPDTLFNLGQASRKLERYDDAIRYYKLYLGSGKVIPESEREAIEARLPELERLSNEKKASGEKPPQGIRSSSDERVEEVAPPNRGATKPVAPPPFTPPTDEPRTEPWYRDRTGWVLVASGVVAMGVGGALFFHGAAVHDEALAEPDQTEALNLIDSANTYRVLGSVLFWAGTAVTIAGGVKLAITDRGSSPSGANVWLGPGSVIVRGSF